MGDHRSSGSDRLVLNSTVNEAPGVLVNLNWKVPSPNIFGPVKVEEVPISAADWTTDSICPAMASVPVRSGPWFASNVKVTEPLPEPLVAFRFTQESREIALHACAAVGLTVKTTLLVPASGPT